MVSYNYDLALVLLENRPKATAFSWKPLINAITEHPLFYEKANPFMKLLLYIRS